MRNQQIHANRLLWLASFCTVIAIHGSWNTSWANDSIKVGVFQNKPIVYHEDGPKGLFVDVLNHIATEENWELEYVPCELKNCLILLESNELDLMTSLGESPKRLNSFVFSKESIWTFWGTIYSHDRKIQGFLDLKDKKIGVRRKNKITSALKTMLAEFNIPVQYLEYDNYESAFTDFQEGQLDAVAVNNTYGFDKQKELNLHKTPIVFNPFSAYFAAPIKGRHVEKLAVIDTYVKKFMLDESSPIHSFEKKWFGVSRPYWTGKRIGIVSAILLFCTICGMALWRYLSLVVINKDLSSNIMERKRAQEELQQANESLEQRTVELKKSYEKLAQEVAEKEEVESKLRHAYKMEAVGALAGGIAHDFNNILTAILGYGELLREDIPASSKSRDYIDQIHNASNRARNLVKHILTYSRMETTKPTTINIYIVVVETLELLRASIPTTIRIHKNIDYQIGNITADPNQIHQVLMNLCTNAAQAMDEKGGTLSITLNKLELTKDDEDQNIKRGSYVRLIVRDSGTGIDENIIDRIFDPYFTTKEIGKGTGMGLAVVHGIVKNNNGIISVQSKKGEGSTFTLLFPSAEDSEKQQNEAYVPLLEGTEKILFVDDDVGIARMTKISLGHLGYTVKTETSSTEALELFRSQPNEFDVVITDHTMPELTGQQLAQELLKIRPGMPIIICTGYSEQMDAEKAHAAGISAFMMKPIDRNEMSQTIRQVLDKNS